MAFDIISVGPLLVELIRKEIGRGFGEAGTFAGPYASGDTPIFINAAAKMGAKCGFIGSVGDEEFGECVYNKLKASGVDMSHITIVPGSYTGSTFVYYLEDGSRKFRYHISGSGSEYIYDGNVDEAYFKNSKWVHYTGFTMESSERAKRLVFDSMQILDPGTKVSFDPNLRGRENVAELCGAIIDRADLILPSAGEAGEYFDTTDDEGCKRWMDMGKVVIQKMGAKGSRIYHDGKIEDIPAFKATEVDPTGAGDTFAATLLAGLVEGRGLGEATLRANIAGGFAISAMGPMEGQVDKRVVDAFIASGKDEIIWNEWI